MEQCPFTISLEVHHAANQSLFQPYSSSRAASFDALLEHAAVGRCHGRWHCAFRHSAVRYCFIRVCTGADLADQDGTHHRALWSRRTRLGRTHHCAAAGAAARTVFRGGQPSRRQWPDWYRNGGQGRAGWLYPAGGVDLVRGQSEHVQEAALQPDTRFRSGQRGGLDRGLHPWHQPVSTGEQSARAAGAAEKARREIRLRYPRCRQYAASGGRAVHGTHRHEDGSHSLQGRGSGHCRIGGQ